MTGTAPVDGQACYTEFTAYLDDYCSIAEMTAGDIWKDLKLTETKKAADCFVENQAYLTKCDNGKITTIICTDAGTGFESEILYSKYDGSECV